MGNYQSLFNLNSNTNNVQRHQRQRRQQNSNDQQNTNDQQHCYYYYQQGDDVINHHLREEDAERQRMKLLELFLFVTEFRPVLQLLWPHLDFSDDLILRLKMIGRDDQLVLTKEEEDEDDEDDEDDCDCDDDNKNIDTEFDIEAYRQGPFSLLGFLQNRGISTIAGLSIFRKVDIKEANEFMYYNPPNGFNNDNQLLENFQDICIHSMVDDNAATLQDHVDNKGVNEKLCCNGLCDIKRSSQEYMRDWRNEANEWSDIILTSNGAAEMIQNKTFFKFSKSKTTTSDDDDDDDDDNEEESNARLDVEEVDLKDTKWTLDGFLTIMAFLCHELPTTSPLEQHHNNNNNNNNSVVRGSLLQELVTIRMEVPLNLVLFSSIAQHFLTNLIRSDDRSYSCYADALPLDFIFHFERIQPRSQEFHFLNNHPQSYAVACRAIAEGFSTTNGRDDDWKGSITIKGMDLTIPEVRAFMLSSSSSSSSENSNSNSNSNSNNNPFYELLKRDNVHKLHVALKNDDFEDDDDDDEKENTMEPFHGKVLPEWHDCSLQCLNLLDLKIGKDCWENLWKNVRTLQNLECVAIDPNRGDELDIGSISAAINAACSLPRLMVLDIQAHGIVGNENCLDLTTAFVSLLQNDRIQDICVFGVRTVLTSAVLGYKINAEKLCRSMEQNTSLKSISLTNVYLLETSSSTNNTNNNDRTELATLTQDLISMMQRSKTSNLGRILMCGSDNIYAGTGAGSLNLGLCYPLYKNYNDALYLEYLAKMNRFGIGKIQDKSSTTNDVVRALLKTINWFGDYGMNVSTAFRREILKLVGDLNNTFGDSNDDDDDDDCSSDDSVNRLFRASNSAESVTRLYLELRESPSAWCRAPEQEVECVGILYGLLRVRPDLWCNAHHAVCSNKRDIIQSCNGDTMTTTQSFNGGGGDDVSTTQSEEEEERPHKRPRLSYDNALHVFPFN